MAKMSTPHLFFDNSNTGRKEDVSYIKNFRLFTGSKIGILNVAIKFKYSLHKFTES